MLGKIHNSNDLLKSKNKEKIIVSAHCFIKNSNKSSGLVVYLFSRDLMNFFTLSTLTKNSSSDDKMWIYFEGRLTRF